MLCLLLQQSKKKAGHLQSREEGAFFYSGKVTMALSWWQEGFAYIYSVHCGILLLDECFVFIPLLYIMDWSSEANYWYWGADDLTSLTCIVKEIFDSRSRFIRLRIDTVQTGSINLTTNFLFLVVGLFLGFN
jgi:hypothetical protein